MLPTASHERLVAPPGQQEVKIGENGIPTFALSYDAWKNSTPPDYRYELDHPVLEYFAKFPTRSDAVKTSTNATEFPPILPRIPEPPALLFKCPPPSFKKSSMHSAPPMAPHVAPFKAPFVPNQTQVALLPMVSHRAPFKAPYVPKQAQVAPPTSNTHSAPFKAPFVPKSSGPGPSKAAPFKAPPPANSNAPPVRTQPPYLEARKRCTEALAKGAAYREVPANGDEWNEWMAGHPHVTNSPVCGEKIDNFSVEQISTEMDGEDVPQSMKGKANEAVQRIQEQYPHVCPLLSASDDADGDMPTISRVKVGLCTSILNRRHQMELALPISLANAWKHRQWLKFYIVDFGSVDGLADWIVETFPEALQAGFLRFYKAKETYFHASMFKNTAHRLAIEDECDVVVNLDADNIVSSDFGLDILQKMGVREGRKRVDALQFYSGGRDSGTFGRIACFAADFEFMRGYDEDTFPAGSQDSDFVARLELMNRRLVKCNGASAIPNDKTETCRNVDPEFANMPWNEMDNANGKKMKKLRTQGQIVRNAYRKQTPFYGIADVKRVQVSLGPVTSASTGGALALMEITLETQQEEEEKEKKNKMEKEREIAIEMEKEREIEKEKEKEEEKEKELEKEKEKEKEREKKEEEEEEEKKNKEKKKGNEKDKGRERERSKTKTKAKTREKTKEMNDKNEQNEKSGTASTMNDEWRADKSAMEEKDWSQCGVDSWRNNVASSSWGTWRRDKNKGAKQYCEANKWSSWDDNNWGNETQEKGASKDAGRSTRRRNSKSTTSAVHQKGVDSKSRARGSWW